MKYALVYEKASGNFSAYKSDLPGCVAAGGAREETEHFIREAIGFLWEGPREAAEPIAEQGAWTETVEASC